MKPLAKILAAALMISGAAVATAAPANAGVGFSIEFGGPRWYSGYDYNRPCWWYREYDLPAPYRCYQYFNDMWGSGMYVDGDFIFRDRDDWYRWRDRDDYRHWRTGDYRWQGDRDGWRGDRGHDWGGGRGWMNWGGEHDRARGHDGDHGGWDNRGGDRHGDGDHGHWDRGGHDGRDYDR